MYRRRPAHLVSTLCLDAKPCMHRASLPEAKSWQTSSPRSPQAVREMRPRPARSDWTLQF
jgi:hypothetical protein